MTLSVAARLKTGFGCIMLVLAVIAGLGIFNMSRIESNLNSIVSINNKESSAATEMLKSKFRQAYLIRDMALMSDQAEMKATLARINEARKNYAEKQEELNTLFSQPGGSSTGLSFSRPLYRIMSRFLPPSDLRRSTPP